MGEEGTRAVNDNNTRHQHSSQFALLGQRRFAPFFWTQFLGAANDNLFKFAFTVLVTYQLTVSWLPAAQAGLVIGGMSPDGLLAEMIELRDHPFFVACQFHPEFTSTPRGGHPLFSAFVAASVTHRSLGMRASPGGALSVVAA